MMTVELEEALKELESRYSWSKDMQKLLSDLKYHYSEIEIIFVQMQRVERRKKQR